MLLGLIFLGEPLISEFSRQKESEEMGSAYEENTCSDVFIPTFTIPRIRLSIPQA